MPVRDGAADGAIEGTSAAAGERWKRQADAAAEDAERHPKKADNAKRQRMWAEIANSVLAVGRTTRSPLNLYRISCPQHAATQKTVE
jgi:hypothetical protein